MINSIKSYPDHISIFLNYIIRLEENMYLNIMDDYVELASYVKEIGMHRTELRQRGILPAKTDEEEPNCTVHETTYLFLKYIIRLEREGYLNTLDEYTELALYVMEIGEHRIKLWHDGILTLQP